MGENNFESDHTWVDSLYLWIWGDSLYLWISEGPQFFQGTLGDETGEELSRAMLMVKVKSERWVTAFVKYLELSGNNCGEMYFSVFTVFSVLFKVIQLLLGKNVLDIWQIKIL